MLDFLLTVAIAQSVPQDVFGPDGPMPADTVNNTALCDIVGASAIVALGTLEQERSEVWLGPSSHQEIGLWRISVTETWVGHASTGHIDIPVPTSWPPELPLGTEMLLFASGRTLYLPTFMAGRRAPFEAFPVYDDLLVPTVHGSIFFNSRDDAGNFGWPALTSLEGTDWLPSDPDEVRALEWGGLVARAKAALDACPAAQRVGSTVPGSVAVEEMQ